MVITTEFCQKMNVYLYCVQVNYYRLSLSGIICREAEEGTVLDNVEKIRYLGMSITNVLKWNTHVCTNAYRTLGFLRRIKLGGMSTGRLRVGI